jgi:SAM-dependent methyltransferase
MMALYRLMLPLYWRWPFMSVRARMAQRQLDEVANTARASTDEAEHDLYVVWAVRRYISHEVGCVLDLGAGDGRYSHMVPAIAYCANEPHEGRWQSSVARTQTQRVYGDAYGLDAVDELFDVVTMFHVLHHLVDRPRVFAECARVLRPSGRLLMVEPRHTWKRALRVLHSWATDYVWTRRPFQYATHDFCTAGELHARARASGLHVQECLRFQDRLILCAVKP